MGFINLFNACTIDCLSGGHIHIAVFHLAPVTKPSCGAS